jgi:hypothetical protein
VLNYYIYIENILLNGNQELVWEVIN